MLGSAPPYRGYLAYLAYFAHLTQRFPQTDEIFMFTGVDAGPQGVSSTIGPSMPPGRAFDDDPKAQVISGFAAGHDLIHGRRETFAIRE